MPSTVVSAIHGSRVTAGVRSGAARPVPENGVTGGTVRAWRCVDRSIPNASPSSRSSLLIVVNLAIFGTKKEVRGIPSKERPAAILDLSPQEGEHIIPQQANRGRPARRVHRAALDRSPADPAGPGDGDQAEPLELTFEPSPAHDIHQFAPGVHNATIEYWPRAQDLRGGEGRAACSARTPGRSTSADAARLSNPPRRGSARRAARPSRTSSPGSRRPRRSSSSSTRCW